MTSRPDVVDCNAARGRANREAVRRLLVQFPGIRGHEIGKATGLNPNTVSRHVQSLRQEWQRHGEPR